MDRSKEEAEASSALDVTEELKQQVSLASDLLAEQRWARAGEALSVIHVNDKIVEEKEKELVDCIAQNYSRIKGVERELAGLQLQLKLTNGPKKSALELLRRKIELQNEKVVLARGKFHAARKMAEAAEVALKAEDAVKERLCQELNLLVQQSAHAQLERLEQLTKRMELLNKGFMPETDLELGPKPLDSSARTKSDSPAPADAAAPNGSPLQPREGGCAVPDTPKIPASGTGQADGELAEKNLPAAEQSPPKLNRGVAHESPRRPEISHADQERAAAARARHVSLKSPSKASAAPKATPQKPRRNPNEPFRGFD